MSKQISKSSSYEGFEVWFNDLLMTIQMHIKILIMLLGMHVIVFCLACCFIFDKTSLNTLSQWLMANLLFPQAHMKFTNPNGTVANTTAGYVASLVPLRTYAFGLLLKMRSVFFWCAGIYVFYPACILLFRRKARQQTGQKHLRGSRLISASEYKSLAKDRNDKLDLPFGSVNMPIAAEPRHTFLIGKPGSGKTVSISQVLEKLKARKNKAIVYDFKGDYLRKFYDPEIDLIFNPLDSRSLGWNIFNEVTTIMDVDAIASSLIPPSISQQDPFWHDAARGVLAGILHYLYLGELRTNDYIWKMVTDDGVNIAKRLKSIPQGLRGYRYIEDAGSKQAMGVFSTLMQYAQCFEFMASNEGPFAIDEWLKTGQGMIFITNYPSVQDTLRPILSLFVDLMIRKLLSMPDSTERRIFFLLDEFGTLQRLSSIIKLLTLSRSKGGCCFLGIQDYGQIDRIYSSDYRQSIVNACGNSVVFSLSDTVSAELSSRKLGETEYRETEKSHSMGPDIHRDGTNLAERKKREHLFLASDIMNLPDLTGIVRFANYHPIVSKFQYKDYPDISEAFVLRQDLLMHTLENDEVSTAAEAM
jgi:type IV secretory pathway TraG/TraD family ATPase VirD4